MNEEERIIRSIKYIINQNYVDTEDDIIGILIKALNLIEKQSKEIEELKEQCKKVVCVPEGTCFMLEPKDINKKWEDKIKAKIEELDKEEKEILKGTKGQDRYAIKQEYMHKRSGLQSLLEKE